MNKEDRPGISQYGISNIKGRWDYWPSGLVVCAPVEDTAEGTMIIDTGDIILISRYVQSPIKLTVRRAIL